MKSYFLLLRFSSDLAHAFVDLHFFLYEETCWSRVKLLKWNDIKTISCGNTESWAAKTLLNLSDNVMVWRHWSQCQSSVFYCLFLNPQRQWRIVEHLRTVTWIWTCSGRKHKMMRVDKVYLQKKNSLIGLSFAWNFTRGRLIGMVNWNTHARSTVFDLVLWSKCTFQSYTCTCTCTWGIIFILVLHMYKS